MVTFFDPKSYELAEHFLKEDAADLTPAQQEQRTQSLALAIQQAVEDWMEDDAVPNVPGMWGTT